ncbi:MAG: peroxidase-related enzyme [Planctomycetota bacterium]|nr:peroxidase-related enzyme [Planctomycetota bacterium]MDE1889032.1 peroxidase-related enzyme [Planctomycetota bacterium]MDE2216418.1 peroxidase-related enzyme [Planctomycetota bacterium]
MARLLAIGKEQVSKEAQDVFAEIEGAFGMVPNLFKIYSHFPPLLKTNWNKVKAVMMQGSLSRKTKEAIALLVSKDNSCAYCVAAHTAALKSIGVTEKEINIIESEIEKSMFTEKERELITFVRKANKDPNRITDKEYESLKKTGASDSEIVEALGVMELFTAFNKFLDSLNVEIDF